MRRLRLLFLFASALGSGALACSAGPHARTCAPAYDQCVEACPQDDKAGRQDTPPQHTESPCDRACQDRHCK